MKYNTLNIYLLAEQIVNSGLNSNGKEKNIRCSNELVNYCTSRGNLWKA